jgi:hypothetical protein
MKGYIFDPSRLACSPKEQERRGYETAAQMLRDYLVGGGVLTAVRKRPRPGVLLKLARSGRIRSCS